VLSEDSDEPPFECIQIQRKFIREFKETHNLNRPYVVGRKKLSNCLEEVLCSGAMTLVGELLQKELPMRYVPEGGITVYFVFQMEDIRAGLLTHTHDLFGTKDKHQV